MSGPETMPVRKEKKKSKELSVEELKQRELTPDEKRALASVWTTLIVHGIDVPPDVETWDKERTRGWLGETLARDVAALAGEWELQPDGAVLEKLKAEAGPSRRADLEMRYIESVRDAIAAFEGPKEEKLNAERSTKWDSWPGQMRLARAFNCVGGTLLGAHFLEAAGIRSHYGNPAGHVLNMVELSDGAWVYADFTNRVVRRIRSEESEIEGIRTLRLAERGIAYRLIPLFENADAPFSILGNISSLERDAKDSKADPLDRAEANQLLAAYSTRATGIDCAYAQDVLYPDHAAVRDNKEVRAERKRVNLIHSFKDERRKLIEALPKEKRQVVLDETRERARDVYVFLETGDRSVLRGAAPELWEVLARVLKDLEAIKRKNPALYADLLNEFSPDQ